MILDRVWQIGIQGRVILKSASLLPFIFSYKSGQVHITEWPRVWSLCAMALDKPTIMKSRNFMKKYLVKYQRLTLLY